jgi:hypothetical protein
MLHEGKNRGFNIETTDYDAQQRDMDGREDVTTTTKNQAQVDELIRMMNKYKSLFEKEDIEKEAWKEKAIMLQEEKNRGFNIETTDYDAK